MYHSIQHRRHVVNGNSGFDPPSFRALRVAIESMDPRALDALVAYRQEYGGGWRHPFIDASIATDLDRLMANRFLIGGPDQIVRALRPFVTEFGATHVICRLFFPGLPHQHILRELTLLAREVIPAFR